MRIVEERATASKVFLVGQALGEQTQRISGRPYTKANGKLSNTGHNLDKFLRLFNCRLSSLPPPKGLKRHTRPDAEWSCGSRARL